MLALTGSTLRKNKSKKKTSRDLHCMINWLASRGCRLLPGPGKGRYQRRLSLPRVVIHKVSWGKGGTLIIPLYRQSLWCFDTKDLRHFIEGEMINSICLNNYA